MPNQPIGLRELLNHIFCATFGQPLSVSSEQELEPIRDSIAKLRRCYKANTPESAYGNSSARQAYMLAYYPYYIQPAMKIFSEIILKEPKIAAANELNLSFMAGGPCSEAIGVTEALQRNGKKCPVNITILDRELGWKDQHSLTQHLCQYYQPEANITGFIGCNILQSCQTCPNAEQCRSKVFDTTNVYFPQNYLSHLPYRDIGLFLERFAEKIRLAKPGSVFAIIDLNYLQSRTVLQKLLETQLPVKLLGTNINQGINIAIHPWPDDLWKEKIFLDQPGLWPKRRVNYYYLVFRREMTAQDFIQQMREHTRQAREQAQQIQNYLQQTTEGSYAI